MEQHLGLSSRQVEESRRLHGSNALPPRPLVPFLSLVWESLQDPTLKLLMVCAVVATLTGASAYETMAIAVAVLVVVAVSSGNNFVMERQFRALSEAQVRSVTVVRDGARCVVPQDDVVVGDCLSLSVGDVVCADGTLLGGSSGVQVDESSLTGEPHSVPKAAGDAVMGLSRIMEGEALMTVTQVGVKSAAGQLAMSLRAESTRTPLEDKLEVLAGQIGKLGLGAAVVVTLLLVIRFWGPDLTLHQLAVFAMTSVTLVVVAVPEGLPLSVTVALAYSVNRMHKDKAYVRRLVACETMGSVTECLTDKTGTLTMNQMSVVAAVVGGAEVTSKKLWKEGRALGGSPGAPSNKGGSGGFSMAIAATPVPAPAAGSSSRLREETQQKSEETMEGALDLRTWSLLREGLAVNSTVFSDAVTHELVGTSTEKALASYILATASQGASAAPPTLASMREEVFRGGEPVLRVPFSSASKVMHTTIALPDGRFRTHFKGASEEILARSTSLHHVPRTSASTSPHSTDQATAPSSAVGMAENNGAGSSLSSRPALATVAAHEELIVELASQGLRTIALAYREGSTVEEASSLASGAVLLAVFGIEDPVRHDVPEAIRSVRRAGITVRMVTGDNVHTAASIAHEAGILDDVAQGSLEAAAGAAATAGSREESGSGLKLASCTSASSGPCTYAPGAVMEGKDFRAMTDAELDRALPTLRVLARAMPLDKQRLVRRLKEQGAVVAVTGDGTNDAPALKLADVGFAMGSGTETAKEASDVVILDDNFATIVRAAVWGRSVLGSIRKFLQFQLTVNIVAVTLSCWGSLVDNDGAAPLKVVQLLWVNLIMDSLGALALSTEEPSTSVLDHKPHGRKSSLFSNAMVRNIAAQACYQLVVLLFLTSARGAAWLGIPSRLSSTPLLHETIIFNTFVLCQLFNEVNCRRIHHRELNIFSGLSRDLVFSAILLSTSALQVLLVQWGGEFAQTTPLSLGQWCTCTLFASGSWAVGLGIRFLARNKNKAKRD